MTDTSSAKEPQAENQQSAYVPPTSEAVAASEQPSAPAQKSGMSKGAKIGLFSCLGCLGLILIVILGFLGIVYTYNQQLQNTFNGQPLTAADKAHIKLAAPLQKQLAASIDTSAYFTQARSMVDGAWGPLECGSNVDKCVMGESKDSAKPQDKTACQTFLELAGKYPLDTFYDASFKPHAMGDQALQTCIDVMDGYTRSTGWAMLSNEFLVTGKTTQGVPFGLELHRGMSPHEAPAATATPTNTSSRSVVDNSLGQYTYSYGIMTSTLFDYPKLHEDVPDLTKQTIRMAAYLDLVAYYRVHATKADPFSLELNQNILNEAIKKFPLSKAWKLVAAAGNKTYLLSVSEPGYQACLAIGVDKILANGDFPSGLPRGSTQELMGLATKPSNSVSASSQFGDYSLGNCPK